MDGEVEVKVNRAFACLAFLAFLAFPLLALAVSGVQMLRICCSLNRR